VFCAESFLRFGLRGAEAFFHPAPISIKELAAIKAVVLFTWTTTITWTACDPEGLAKKTEWFYRSDGRRRAILRRWGVDAAKIREAGVVAGDECLGGVRLASTPDAAFFGDEACGIVTRQGGVRGRFWMAISECSMGG